MKIIDGKKIAAEIKSEIAEEIKLLFARYGKAPGLAVILVGNNPASQVYVRMKEKACKALGIKSIMINLPNSITEENLLNKIKQLNNNDDIDGILVQLPLPAHIDEAKVIENIDPRKDVDGFHPVNMGNLVIGKDSFVPCTPLGILELIKRYKIETSGKHVVVVGRSNIVGKPLAILLMQKKENANAVVTVVHSAAKDISQFTKEADILIAAMGKPEFIKESMIKNNAVVIDVGVNRVSDSATDKGYKLVGDVDFENVAPKTSFITPVPGGVGPMTIAMLMQNTLKSFKNKLKRNGKNN